MGDFNARSNNLCSSEKTTNEGRKREFLTSQYGFKQAISDPTHILKSGSSCEIKSLLRNQNYSYQTQAFIFLFTLTVSIK